MFNIFENEDYDQISKDIGKYIFEKSVGLYNDKTGLYYNNEDDLKYNINALTWQLAKYGEDLLLTFKLMEQNYLYEGLIYSSLPEFIKDKLSNQLGYDDSFDNYIEYSLKDRELVKLYYAGLSEDTYKDDFIKNRLRTKITIKMQIPWKYYKSTDNNILIEINKLFNIINSCGWFISNEQDITKFGKKYHQYDIDPKFIVDITSLLYNKKMILYHITTKEKLEKILKYGLTPRKKETQFEYPERIYFYTQTYLNNIDSYAKDLLRKYSIKELNNISKILNKIFNTNNKDEIISTVLKINITDTTLYDPRNITTQYKFFSDPRSAGIFTLENINPKYISIEKDIKTKINEILITKKEDE